MHMRQSNKKMLVFEYEFSFSDEDSPKHDSTMKMDVMS